MNPVTHTWRGISVYDLRDFYTSPVLVKDFVALLSLFESPTSWQVSGAGENGYSTPNSGQCFCKSIEV